MNNNLNKKRGITLLIAVLTAGLLLSITLSIFNIAIKELIISSSGKDSHIAFYAADSGIECALYWDYRDAFETSGTSDIECAGTDIENVGGQEVSQFSIQIPDSPACATITVTKTEEETLIESRGYNTCETSLRKTERGIRVRY